MWTTTKDRLLVATPALTDPNFDRTVVYVLEHNPDGALGVVINRPGRLPAAAAVPAWADRASEPSMLYDGGPVEPGGVIGLGRRLADGRPMPVDLTEAPDGHDPAVDQIRLFIGSDPARASQTGGAGPSREGNRLARRAALRRRRDRRPDGRAEPGRGRRAPA